ncbi:MAG: DUF4468 domain-containing protein [Saprospiraceae bacterium]
MKRIIYFILLIVSVRSVYAQDSFNFDKIDSTSYLKNEIYSATKLFIAKTWKSANNVIQNDDKESGLIVVKGISKQTIAAYFTEYQYSYAYTFTFRMKDNKFRITLDEIYCDDVRLKNNKCTPNLIQPFDGDKPPSSSSISCLSPSKNKVLKMMDKLRLEMEEICTLYAIQMKEAKALSDDW